MQGALEAVRLDNLRQHGGQSELPPAEDRRMLPKVLFISHRAPSNCRSMASTSNNGNRLSSYSPPSSPARWSASGCWRAASVAGSRTGHFFDELGRKEQVSRRTTDQLGLQGFSQRAGGDQRQVEQPGFAG